MGHGRSSLPTALAGGIIHMDAAPSRPTIPKIPPSPPPPSTVIASHSGTAPQELTTEGSLGPDHPARSPQLICLMKSRWGGISREAAPGLLIFPWQTPVVFQQPSRSHGVPDRVRGQHRPADRFGEADVSDGAVTAMPTHLLPPSGYF